MKLQRGKTYEWLIGDAGRIRVELIDERIGHELAPSVGRQDSDTERNTSSNADTSTVRVRIQSGRFTGREDNAPINELYEMRRG